MATAKTPEVILSSADVLRWLLRSGRLSDAPVFRRDVRIVLAGRKRQRENLAAGVGAPDATRGALARSILRMGRDCGIFQTAGVVVRRVVRDVLDAEEKR